MRGEKHNEFMGYPLRCVPAHQDDCERWDYEVEIDGTWYDVIPGGLRWNREEALDSLVKILKNKINKYESVRIKS
jgi:hypothetical protein